MKVSKSIREKLKEYLKNFPRILATAYTMRMDVDGCEGGVRVVFWYPYNSDHDTGREISFSHGIVGNHISKLKLEEVNDIVSLVQKLANDFQDQEVTFCDAHKGELDYHVKPKTV